MLSVIMLNGVMLNNFMQNVVMLNVVMLNVIMLNAVMLSVVVPLFCFERKIIVSHFNEYRHSVGIYNTLFELFMII